MADVTTWHRASSERSAARSRFDGGDRLTVFGGGYPIHVDGEPVGGLGVSDGHYLADMEVAKAALAATVG